MRAIAVLAFLGICVALIAGCSAIPATQPTVSIPAILPDLSLPVGSAPFFSERIDLTRDETWQQYVANITGFEAVSLSMSAVNRTGETTIPRTARVAFYVSDRGDLTSSTLNQAIPLIDAEFPAGQSVQYDSGYEPLTSGAQTLMARGNFYLYGAGSPNEIALTATQVRMHVKVRVSLL